MQVLTTVNAGNEGFMMIFQHTWQKVLSGEKTQTRRIVKQEDVELIRSEPGDRVFSQRNQLYIAYPAAETRMISAVERNRRHLYDVGKTYAVQVKRGGYTIHYRCLPDGKLQIWNNRHQGLPNFIGDWDEWKTYKEARIEITDIRREDVREISDEDVRAEGFNDPDHFLETWVSMHDKPILRLYSGMYRRGWLTGRPAACYDAWVLTFKLVQS